MRIFKGISAKTTDQELINKYKNTSDLDYVAELYNRYLHLIFSVSLKYLKVKEDAEDLSIKIFEVLQEKLPQQEIGNFGGWLRRIVVNNSIDALKKKHNDLSFDDVHMDIVEQAEPKTEDQDYKIEEIKKAIENLKEDERVIISLFLFEGYDHEEISQILNISYNNSRTRYSRAKKRLLKVLSDQRNLVMFHPNLN
jgi:RNA polymerase sigma factor (sigma-70 family)